MRSHRPIPVRSSPDPRRAFIRVPRFPSIKPRIRNPRSRARPAYYLAAITLLSTACAPSDSDFREFATYPSPDGAYRVVILSANSKLAFGPHTLKVYSVEKDHGNRVHVVTTSLANDGSRLDASNVRVSWIRPQVIRFCLSGAEQKDTILEIDLRTRAQDEYEQTC